MNFILADDLWDAANNTDDQQLKLKLQDTALIYENYDMIVVGGCSAGIVAAINFVDIVIRITIVTLTN